MLVSSRTSSCTALGRPRSHHECPPGPVTVSRTRTEPTASVNTRSAPWPSSASTASGASSRQAWRAPRSPPSPSSPTVKTTASGASAGPASARSATATAVATAIALSPIPGPHSQPSRRVTPRAVASPKTSST